MAAITNLRKWKNGEIFNARDYVYERDAIITQVNRLSALIEGDGAAVNLTVEGLTTNSITLGGQTITSFEEAGIQTYLQNTEPEVFLDGDLWFDTTPLGGE
jgi:hypothetical protein